jgi:hypothetical protein
MTDPRVAILQKAVRDHSMHELSEELFCHMVEALDAHMLSEEVVERVAEALCSELASKLAGHPMEWARLSKGADGAQGQWKEVARAALRSLAGGK